jgi:hypothetical protein
MQHLIDHEGSRVTTQIFEAWQDHGLDASGGESYPLQPNCAGDPEDAKNLHVGTWGRTDEPRMIWDELGEIGSGMENAFWGCPLHFLKLDGIPLGDIQKVGNFLNCVSPPPPPPLCTG